MGIASIAFSGGPSLKFRLDPEDIQWDFKILTNVTETMGGRVVQVIGATLSDCIVKGSVGEQRGTSHLNSWQLAEAFFAKIAEMMDFQTRGANGKSAMVAPAVFSYPPLDVRLAVYIKAVADSDGQGSVSHRQGKYSYGYQLTLFIVPEGSDQVKIAGTNSNGYLDKKRQAAIDSAMNRIADGIGWHYSEAFNGPSAGSGIGGAMTAANNAVNNIDNVRPRG